MTDIKEIVHFSAESNKKDAELFINMLHHVYSLDHFRKLLNVVFSISTENRMLFNLCTNLPQDNKHGLCETLLLPVHKKILNKFFKQKKYQISIKKLSYGVIIHEIAHAIEKELEIDLKKEFIQCIENDLKKIKQSNIILIKEIYALMVHDLQCYDKAQHNSEIFARYFEIFAMAQEVSGEKSIYISDLEKLFKETKVWMLKFLEPHLDNHTNDQIMQYSKRVALKNVEYNKINWKAKTHTLKKSTWSNKIDSNFS